MNYSPNYLSQCLSLYIEQLKTIRDEKGQVYQSHALEAKRDFLDCVEMLNKLNPELYQVNMPEFFGQADARLFKERLRTNADHRYSMDILPLPERLTDLVNNDMIETPAFVPWQQENNLLRNFVIHFVQQQQSAAQSALNTLVLNMLLGLPPGKLRLNVIDFHMTGMAGMFTSRLNAGFYHDDIIYDDNAAATRLKGLLEQMAIAMRNHDDIIAYNNRKQKIAIPYELVIINSYPFGCDSIMRQLMPLFQNGPKYGIFFILLHNSEFDSQDKAGTNLLDVHNYHTVGLPTSGNSNAIVKYTPISARPLLVDMCFEYLNEEYESVQKDNVVKPDFDTLTKAAFVPTLSEISVAIGMDVERNAPVNIRFNSGDYIHAFILGQSGSGKSVMLNNIITSAINKYAPEDLMLYLMDFKGVEFNRFKGDKHTKAVLVDNSDPQMTLTILRELRDENRKRINMWQADGVNSIDGYNRKHPDRRMPQILFVADECQVMFSKPSVRSSSYAMQSEIADILNTIATQGRSQGIHMLLATQTLDDTFISGQVLNNLTECFMLMCSPYDSNILVPNSGDLTSKQPTGQCHYFHKKELVARVQTYYTKDDEFDRAIAASQGKSAHCTNNGGYYFNGSAIFQIDEREKESIVRATSRTPIATVGHNVSLDGDITAIRLGRDFAENILFFGANRDEQAVGTMLSAFISLVISYRQLNKPCDFIVIDCLPDSEKRYAAIIDAMNAQGLCRIIERYESGMLFKQLVEDICNQSAHPTVIAIVGCEQFTEMKRKTPLPSRRNASPGATDDIMNMNLGNMFNDNVDSLDPNRIKTYPEALKLILDEGPRLGIHVLLQVDKPQNIFFEGEYSSEPNEKFHHKVILRTENKNVTPLRLSVDIDAETLGEEEGRLRAYFCTEGREPRLFTPYVLPKSNDFINILTSTI